MCDTLIALGNSTEDGSVIIAKNSDREPNECQVIRYFPRAKNASHSTVCCTHIEIPQVTETNEIVLSSPYWIWGGEMGANEHGVAIGNEAAWSKEPYAKTGLLGMDLLRLGLERGDTAKKALNVITSLLQDYGQGGSNSVTGQNMYHNTYIIADPREAWVLETADRFWIAERVRNVRTISNGYTIGQQWDFASPNIVGHAIEKGWCKSREDFNFTRCYSDQTVRPATACEERSKRTLALLEEAKGTISAATMMKILRDHGEKPGLWAPHKAAMRNVCMHASSSVFDLSAGSYVGQLTGKFATHWLTGASNPCISVFIPTFLNGAGSSQIFSKGSGSYDDSSPWWRHERLSRIVQLDYASRAPPIQREIQQIEKGFFQEVQRLRDQIVEEERDHAAKILHDFTEECSKRTYEYALRWATDSLKTGNNEASPATYRSFWDRYNVKAKLTL
jgi:dipeptidase